MTKLRLDAMAARMGRAHLANRRQARTLAGCCSCEMENLAGVSVTLTPKRAVGAASGAATGATAGAALGPVGSIVGGIIGAASSLVGPKKVAVAEATWDQYKAVAGRNLGRDYEALGFAEIVKGAFDSNRKMYLVDRENLLAQVAGAIVGALKSGVVPSSVNAPQMYAQVIRPFLYAGKVNRAEFDRHGTMPLLWTDIADRYLNNLPITRADTPGIKGGPYTVHAPLLFDALGMGTSQPAAPAQSAAVPAQPLTTIKTPEPTPATTAQALPIVASLVPMGGAGVPATFAPIASTVPSAAPDRTVLYIVGGVAGLLAVLMLTKRGRR